MQRLVASATAGIAAVTVVAAGLAGCSDSKPQDPVGRVQSDGYTISQDYTPPSYPNEVDGAGGTQGSNAEMVIQAEDGYAQSLASDAANNFQGAKVTTSGNLVIIDGPAQGIFSTLRDLGY